MKPLSKFSYKLAITIVLFFLAAVASVSLYNKNISGILEEDAYDDLANANSIRSLSIKERLESTDAILAYLSTIVADNIYDPIEFSSKLTYAGSEYHLGVINYLSLNQINEILSSSDGYDSAYIDMLRITLDSEKPSLVQYKEGDSDVVSILYPVLKPSETEISGKSSNQPSAAANEETGIYGIITCSMTLENFMEKYFATTDKRISTCVVDLITELSFTIITNDDNSYRHVKEPFNDEVSITCSSSSHNSLLEAYEHSDGIFFSHRL